MVKFCIAVVDAPHSFVTVKEIECGPLLVKTTGPGFWVVEVAGVPPTKIQSYVGVVAPHPTTFGTGVMVIGPQEFAMAGNVTVGGFFTITVCVVVVLPQMLDTVSLIV